jgi:asparaginyl-tRNA synthetase
MKHLIIVISLFCHFFVLFYYACYRECAFVGIGELIGGSQREDRLDQLKLKLAEFKLNEADYWWYLDLRKYGSVPHAGYGLGFERLVCYTTGVPNIRDAIAYPRYPGSAEF